MNEREQARQTADRWLQGLMNGLVEMVPGDPDCDACALARSYLRALEKIERLSDSLRQYALEWARREAQRGDLPIPVERELADEWPKAVFANEHP